MSLTIDTPTQPMTRGSGMIGAGFGRAAIRAVTGNDITEIMAIFLAVRAPIIALEKQSRPT